MGKSTFCLQLAENVVAGRIPVLYFSLEMPELWIVAKAISRRLFQMGSPITVARLLCGGRCVYLCHPLVGGQGTQRGHRPVPERDFEDPDRRSETDYHQSEAGGAERKHQTFA